MSTPIRIVILEDRAADAELMLLELHRGGFAPTWQRVDSEPSYLAALETDPDLILADWTLPQFSGLRALQLMKERDLDIPFVIVSGSIGEEVAVEALRQGAADYLLKDRLTRLGQAIQRALEDRQLRVERKRAEQALREESIRRRILFEQSPDGIVIIDPETTRFLDFNTAAHRQLGYSREEFAQLSIADVEAKETAEETKARIAGVIRDGRADFETLHRTREGEIRNVHVTVQIVDVQGQPVYQCIWRDITARKQAEEERERLVAQIRGQAQQTVQILATVPEGVLLVDAGGQILQANPVAENALATLAEAKVGEILTHLGDRPLADLLTSPPTRGLWHEVKADKRTFEVIARPVQSALGLNGNGAEQWVLVINDVTQEREIQAQLLQQERLAAVGQLAAGIAHDFNNILAIIALHAPLVARAPGLTDHDRQRLQVISEQTTHATRLIQQLLDFGRRAELERRPLDLGSLLKEQVRLLARTLPETIAVTLACEPGEHVVLADPTRLQQMLMNLAVNARDAMPTGGALRLRLAQQESAPRPGLPTGPWVRLEVADSGTGIPPEALSHIFEPFFTTKPRGQGTGLGLAQVHGIVKQHDGEIVVHSTPGQGATFTIYLPIVAGSAPASAAPEVVAQQGSGERILIVEDNAALQAAMSDIVEMLGYDVVTASNGTEALALLEAPGNAIALVLSDLVMPVMGGEALLAAIRARGLAVPVVMLSGHPLESELEELKAHGLAGWLLKPPDVDQLARLLAQARH